MNVAHIEHEQATSSIKAAKNILDLDRRFSVEFGQTTSMVATAREFNQTLNFEEMVDKKILNIVRKLKNRFDIDAHKARNEELIRRMREKHDAENLFNNDLPKQPHDL